MRSGYNPTRRNRNIGTAAQGHGRDNRLTIPKICNAERTWWEQIKEYEFFEFDVHGQDVAFFVEALHPDFIHACTMADVLTILRALPAEDLVGMDTVVFRQPTRKQSILESIWGRMAYSANIGRPQKSDSRCGPAIFLEAHRPSQTLKWPRSLVPEDRAEMDRLLNDGHQLEDTGKILKLHLTPESIRNTQLYRTLPHEVGHWVDWHSKVVRPAGGNADLEDSLAAIYWTRSKTDREAFAHRYADEIAKSLRQRSVIPFAPLA